MTHLSRTLTALLLLGTLAGCAQERAAAPAWRDQAQAVAAQRIARQQCAPRPAAETGLHSETLSSTETARGAFELNVARVVADSPAAGTTPSAETQPAEREAVTVTLDRGPLPTLGETLERDIKEFPGMLWHDTKKVYCNPWNVLFLVGAGGASLALRPEVDDDIEDFYRPNRCGYRHTFPEDFRDFFDAAGNPGTHFAVAGAFYLGGQLLQDAKTYEFGKRTLSALTITGLSTVLLKLAAADTKAPNDMFYAWPSGHMSSTMALATCLHEAYGWPVGVPAYAFSVFAGWQRLDSREHMFSDVVFGAALGWVVAKTVMDEHRPEICGGEIVPYVDPVNGHAGVGWLKTLGE